MANFFSDNEDLKFFIAHADLALIQALPRDRRDRPEHLEFIHVFMERWRTLPQVTIAVLTPLAIFAFIAFWDVPVAAVMLVFALVTLVAPAAFVAIERRAETGHVESLFLGVAFECRTFQATFVTLVLVERVVVAPETVAALLCKRFHRSLCGWHCFLMEL